MEVQFEDTVEVLEEARQRLDYVKKIYSWLLGWFGFGIEQNQSKKNAIIIQ